MKRGNLVIDVYRGKMSYEEEGRGQGDASTCQGCQSLSSTEAAGGTWNRIFSHSPQKEPTLPTF